MGDCSIQNALNTKGFVVVPHFDAVLNLFLVLRRLADQSQPLLLRRLTPRLQFLGGVRHGPRGGRKEGPQGRKGSVNPPLRCVNVGP